MADIFGLDISHWNGKVINWKKAWNAGIRFVYIKFSQGLSYADDCAITNSKNAQAVGMKVGAYHFVDNSNGINQANWFITCMNKAGVKFDLTPVLDCEFTTTIKPTQSIVDVIAMRLCGYQGFPLPAIYTNAGFGNQIFTSTSMKKYPLWVAHWGVTKPTLPNVWKGEQWYIWQDAVIDGKPYGFPSKVDHNKWGSKIPFPDTPPEPTPQPEDTLIASLTVKKPDGSTYINENIILKRK